MAKRVMVLGQGGRIVYDYDMKIAEPFEKPGGEAGVDLWPALEALAGRPVLLIRGAFTLLSADAGRDARRIPMPRRSPCPGWAMPPRWTSPRPRRHRAPAGPRGLSADGDIPAAGCAFCICIPASIPAARNCAASS
jgi:hypothetical protein